MKRRRRRNATRVFRFASKFHCRWGIRVETKEADKKKGYRLVFRCYDCCHHSFYKTVLEVPRTCPHCFNPGRPPEWAKRTARAVKEGSFEYTCVFCSELFRFDSFSAIPAECPKCHVAYSDPPVRGAYR